jgi:Na+-transporting NADH:ubiquinone oxidoreductase subunit C
MNDQESVGRTLAVATVVAVVCSLIVSVTVYWLRPIQLAMRSVEQNRAVLIAAGLAEPTATLEDSEVVARFLSIETRLADLDAASFVAADASMVAAYDFRAAADDPERNRAIDADADLASLGTRPIVMPVYLLQDGARLERIILPVYGRGMWSTIYGYIALRGDLITVADVWFYEHGETAGIGDRILDPDWLTSWTDKRAYLPTGEVQLRIGSPTETTPELAVDSITGATVTVNAVDLFVRYWLGDDGYGPLLNRMRAGS